MSTSWESVDKWYDKAVGKEGHYYHQTVILPKALKLLALEPTSSLLDLGCGQGILAKHIPKGVKYLGIDSSPSLIKSATQASKPHLFKVADVTHPLPWLKETFSHAAFILSLQNMAHPEKALQNAAHHLMPEGKLLLVLNHPCFRIPRQSSWGVDAAKKIQYRRMDSYLTFQKIPIQMHPGKGKESQTTFSFHFSLSQLSEWLASCGFAIAQIEEWISPRQSQGKMAKMENRARQEFPLFLAIIATQNKSMSANKVKKITGITHA